MDNQIGKRLKLAIWSPTDWALGRIAAQIAKYAQCDSVKIYDWRLEGDNRRLFVDEEWRKFDFIITNSHIVNWYPEIFGKELPFEMRSKFCVIIHCPRFDQSQNAETPRLLGGLNYGGVSLETCENLKEIGVEDPVWIPFGVDTEIFKQTKRSQRQIQRIGFVGHPNDGKLPTDYYANKGQDEFEKICQLTGSTPVYLNGAAIEKGSKIYDNIDLLICCSQFEGGPLGILEAAACGIPVLTKKVGNVSLLKSIQFFNTINDAVQQIFTWNWDLIQLVAYTDRVKAEVVSEWSSSQLINKHLLGWCVKLSEARMESKIANVLPPIRLHLPAIPHTITRSEFSHCAFTGKVLRFSPMMRSRGFEVYHYGVATSESGATKQIDLFNVEEWQQYRVLSYKVCYPDHTEEQCRAYFEDHSSFVGALAKTGTPLYDEFNRRLRIELMANYRGPTTDIVCLPFVNTHQPAIDGLDVIAVESGIGYPGSYRDYRIFESYAWLHHQLGKEDKPGPNYWFVIPNYFDMIEWPFSANPTPNKVGFFGRIYDSKGLPTVVELAKRFPWLDFVLCGQGDAKPYLTEPNISYQEPISGMERGVYLGSLIALIAPTVFVEPFCGVAVEAQLCGTPVLTVDHGAQTETVEQGVTGLRCHTMAEFCLGLQMVLDGKFDRQYIRNRAVARYDMLNVAIQYEHAFKSLIDVHNGQNGFFSPTSHLQILYHPGKNSTVDFVEIGSVHHPNSLVRRADSTTHGYVISPLYDAIPRSLTNCDKNFVSTCCGIITRGAYNDNLKYWYLSREDAIRNNLPTWMEDYVTTEYTRPDDCDTELLVELRKYGLCLSILRRCKENAYGVSLLEMLKGTQMSRLRHLAINTPGAPKILLDFAKDLENANCQNLLPMQISFQPIFPSDMKRLNDLMRVYTKLNYKINIKGDLFIDMVMQYTKQTEPIPVPVLPSPIEDSTQPDQN